MATSVRTLTTGSQATVGVPAPDFSEAGEDASLRVAWAAGMRTSTDVSDAPLSCSEMVRIGAPQTDAAAIRSALANRLTAMAGGVLETGGLEIGWTAPERSRPIANCTAPKVNESAIVPKIPVVNLDMAAPAIRGRPCGDQANNAREPVGFYAAAVT